MRYTTIYEAKPFYGVSWTFIVVVLLFIVLLILGIIMCNKNPNGRIIDKLGPFIVDVVLLVVIISTIYSGLDSKIKVYDKFANGNYLTADGIIEKYEEIKGISNEIKYDQFQVNDVIFYVPSGTTCWGYPLKQSEGGVLKNNLKVKIYYINYKYENVIMKLELEH